MSDGEGPVAVVRNEDVIWLRPEQAALGRPAERSRAEITAAAVALADREGLGAVSMRRVAAEVGTGAASLYRYVATREDLLDLMIDEVGAEYTLTEPAGDWLAELVGIGQQMRAVMLRHPWLAALVTTRATLGPNGVALLEHILDVLADHPASGTTKLEAFAMFNALVAVFAQNELGGASVAHQRQAAYLSHVAASGEHPRIAQLLTQAGAPARTPEERFEDILARALSGLLATARPGD